MTTILWDYARKLSYPEARLLAKMFDTVSSQLEQYSMTANLMPDTQPRVRFNANETQILKADLNYEFARRLEQAGLVEITDHPLVANVAPLIGLVGALREFIWGDGELPDEVVEELEPNN